MNTRTAVHTDKESPFAPIRLRRPSEIMEKMTRYPAECLPLLLQHLTERLRGLPRLFIADMGIAHGRADILVAKQFLDFPQILSHLVEEDRGGGVAQPMRGDLPYPEGSTGGPQPQIERPVGKRRA